MRKTKHDGSRRDFFLQTVRGRWCLPRSLIQRMARILDAELLHTAKQIREGKWE